MANKHQVLKLLDKGLSPPQIAKKLGCTSGYVRATQQRRENPDRYAKYTKAHYDARYGVDMEWTERRRQRAKNWYARRKRSTSADRCNIPQTFTLS